MNPTKLYIRILTATLTCSLAFVLYAQSTEPSSDTVTEPGVPAIAETNVAEEAAVETAVDVAEEADSLADAPSGALPLVEVPSVTDIVDTTGMPEVPSIDLSTSADPSEGMDLSKTIDPVTSNELLSVNFEGVPLDTVVRFISLNANVSIIIPDGLDAPVTATLYNQEWRQALDSILDVHGFMLLEKKGGIYTIRDKNDLDADPLILDKLEFKYITVADAIPVVEGMLISSNATVNPLEAANVIYISETASRIQEIKAMLEEVDLPRKQVFIEAKFVELNDQAIQDLGINWSVLQGYSVRAQSLSIDYQQTRSRTDQDAQAFVHGKTFLNSGLTTDQSAVTGDPAIPPLTTTINNQLLNQLTTSESKIDAVVQGRNFEALDAETGELTTTPIREDTTLRSAVLSADEFSVTLSALKQLDGVRIVSNPKMLVANGEHATIHVGRDEPNIRATLVEGENTSSYVYGLDEENPFISIGVKLEVQPVIYTERNISLVIRPELSRLLGQKIAGEAGVEFPIISTRTIDTEFALESGKTVAIGGLTEGTEKETVKKVPVLGEIPVLGKYLFTHTHTEEVQDEIIVFVSVEMAHVEALNATHGIPQEGKLIQTWLQQNAGGSPKVQDKSIEEILSGINLGETD